MTQSQDSPTIDGTRFPDRWRIRAAQMRVETFSSRIWDVQIEDGTLAVVKDLKPFDDVADELRGAHYLSWRGGVGAVRLLCSTTL